MCPPPPKSSPPPETERSTFFSWSIPHPAPCLLWHFPHLTSSLGHETVRFTLGRLLKIFQGCGVAQEPINPRDRQNQGPHE